MERTRAFFIKETNSNLFLVNTPWKPRYRDVGGKTTARTFTSQANALRMAERLNRQVPEGCKKRFAVEFRTLPR